MASIKEQVDIKLLELKEKVIRLERRNGGLTKKLQKVGELFQIKLGTAVQNPAMDLIERKFYAMEALANIGKHVIEEVGADKVPGMIGSSPLDRVRYLRDRAELLNELLKAMRISTHPAVVKPVILQRIRAFGAQALLHEELMNMVGLNTEEHSLNALVSRVREFKEMASQQVDAQNAVQELAQIAIVLKVPDTVNISSAVSSLKREYDNAKELLAEMEPNAYQREIQEAAGYDLEKDTPTRQDVIDRIKRQKELADKWREMGDTIERGPREAYEFRVKVRMLLNHTAHSSNKALLAMIKELKDKAAFLEQVEIALNQGSNLALGEIVAIVNQWRERLEQFELGDDFFEEVSKVFKEYPAEAFPGTSKQPRENLLIHIKNLIEFKRRAGLALGYFSWSEINKVELISKIEQLLPVRSYTDGPGLSADHVYEKKEDQDLRMAAIVAQNRLVHLVRRLSLLLMRAPVSADDAGNLARLSEEWEKEGILGKKPI